MVDKINALVVGAGGFGRHHARILSRLTRPPGLGLLSIGKLAVSHTTMTSAERSAEILFRDDRCTAYQIVPVQIENILQLQKVLAELTPQFISLCARDKEAGDKIHAIYTAAALPYGAVLCEKPFSEANGDGRSLKQCQSLINQPTAARFGLELPMSVVARNMLRSAKIHQWFNRANELQIIWAADIPRKHMLINELALHSWSLLYPVFYISVIQVEELQSEVHIDLGLKHRHSGREIEGHITLKNSGNFRAIGTDQTTIVLEMSAKGVTLIRLEQPLDVIARTAHFHMEGQPVLQVDNPLADNILAVLKKQPLVGLSDTCASQLFLERLHGYLPP